jgi:hypothetical protein
MKVYLGQANGRWLIAELVTYGWGECVQRGELPPKRQPWFFDNGAFLDWRHDRSFDVDAYRRDLELLRAHPQVKPDFAVTPDIVTGGLDSLRFSLEWVDAVAEVASPYLAVQDGMEAKDVTPHLDRFDGLFVGGSVPWKRRTGAAWVELAHQHGLPCHIGRVGGIKSVRWALEEAKPDSIDSCLPLFARRNLKRFKAALKPSQRTIWDVNRSTDGQTAIEAGQRYTRKDGAAVRIDWVRDDDVGYAVWGPGRTDAPQMRRPMRELVALLHLEGMELDAEEDSARRQA